MTVFEGKTILITGGTGSLGTALTKRLLSTKASKIRIFSRDEWKQTNMKSQLPDKRLRFLIGDIRDRNRLYRAMENVDIVFHAAALKHVPVAEYNPFEFVKTNVDGAQNVIDSCLDNEVELVLLLEPTKQYRLLQHTVHQNFLWKDCFFLPIFTRAIKRQDLFASDMGMF